ncbi:MAG: sodium:solute symporter [Acidobacteriota bacterium]
MTAVDLAVLALYFVAVLGIGVRLRRGGRSSEAFMTAQGRLPGWLCGMSILATYVSSISFLALPGSAYAFDWSRFAFSLSIPPAAWLAARHFTRLYRRQGEPSAYAFLESRFGLPARLYASTFYLLTQLFRMGVILYLTALPLSTLLNWPVWGLVSLLGLSVMIYCLLAGIEGVIWADAIQGWVLTAGAVGAVAVLLAGMPGGPAQALELAVRDGKFSLGNFAPSFGEATFWVILLNGLFVNLQNFGIDQNYIQRYLAASSEREARRAVWLGGLLYLPLSALFFLVGSCLYSFYQAQPGVLPAELPADQVFPWFIVHGLPPGVSGFLIAAVFAAAMSTLSTSLNSSATVVLEDYFVRWRGTSLQESTRMLVLRSWTVLFALAAVGVALLVMGARSALDAWWTGSSIFSGGMLGLFLLAWLFPRTSPHAALAGMLVGLAGIAWMTLSRTDLWTWASLPSSWASPLHEWMVIVAGTLLILAGAVGGSRLAAVLARLGRWRRI